MPKFQGFDLSKAKGNDLSEVQAYQQDTAREIKKGTETAYNALAVIDAKAQNAEYLTEFTRAFNVEMGYNPSKGVKFNALEQAQELKTFDTTGSSVTTTVGTDIIPTIESLVRDSSLLSRVSIEVASQPNSSKQLWDFNAEQNAAFLSEVAAGTDVDDTIRQGDVLIPKYKLQASAKFSEYALSTMTTVEEAQFLARFTKRVQYTLINAILQNGTAAANGTAKNSLRGIINNFGINGTGDAANFIGAIQYPTKAAADAALGTASSDAYDLCVKVKRQLLPNNVSDIEEQDYIFVMNRLTWGKVSTVVDLNGRYKAQTSVDPATNKAIKSIDGTEVSLFAGVADDFVFCIPLKDYVLYTFGGIMNLNDGGIVQLREGLYSFVSRVWCDGSMRYGHKYLSTTAATIGTTAVDNHQQNAYRYFKIV